MEDTGNWGAWVWSLAVIGGPIILGIALAWLVIMNRRRTRARDAARRGTGGQTQRHRP
jgi:hypothetical protein